MKTIIATVGIFLALASSAKSQLDSLMFNLVNQYRYSIGIQPLQWDARCFKEADIISAYLNNVPQDFNRLVDADSEITREPNVYKGTFGIYVLDYIIFDGDFDKLTYNKIAALIFQDLVDSYEVRQILINPNATYGACGVAAKVIYMKNPDLKSSIKRFSLWYISVSIGIAY